MPSCVPRSRNAGRPDESRSHLNENAVRRGSGQCLEDSLQGTDATQRNDSKQGLGFEMAIHERAREKNKSLQSKPSLSSELNQLARMQ
jgi:hypothetical protein